MEPLIFNYKMNNKGCWEVALCEKYNASIVEVRKWEVQALTDNEFDLIDCELNATKPAIIHCNKCGNDFTISNYASKMRGRGDKFGCDCCGHRVFLDPLAHDIVMCFLLDSDYAEQYYGAILAFTVLRPDEKYYVLQNNSLFPHPPSGITRLLQTERRCEQNILLPPIQKYGHSNDC